MSNMNETSENLQITILEKQIIHAIIDNPNLLFEDDIFVSEQAKEFQYILLTLKDKNMDFIEEHILCESIEYINRETVISVKDTDYQKEFFDDYKRKLYQKYLMHEFKINTLYEINKEDTDYNKLIKLNSDLSEALKTIDNPTSQSKNWSDMINTHVDILKERKEGKQNSIGDYNFDKMIKPYKGIWTICGYSGSCKSTLLLNLLKTRIVKGNAFKSTYFNTELAESGIMDILLPSMIKESYDDVRGAFNDDEHIDFDIIIDKAESIKDHYNKFDNFRYFDNPTVTLNDLETFNVQTRKELKMKDDELLVSFVDLLSMVKEFSEIGKGNKSDSIVQAMDRLNNIALKHNILFICTVQLKRPPSNIKIEKEEDLRKFMPDASMIRDSGGYEERSRAIFLIFNPFNVVNKNPCNEVIKALVEPIIDVTCVKNTFGSIGTTVKYYHNVDNRRMIPYESTEEFEILDETEMEVENAVE